MTLIFKVGFPRDVGMSMGLDGREEEILSREVNESKELGSKCLHPTWLH